MVQYYYTDGIERYGPFTIEQLRERNITRETLVWKEGMADWAPANQLNELQALFATEGNTPAPPYPHQNPVMPGSVQYAQPPKNWLVESILVTLFCCPWVFGILAIINAAKVETL